MTSLLWKHCSGRRVIPGDLPEGPDAIRGDPKYRSPPKKEDPTNDPKPRVDHVEGDSHGQKSDPNFGSMFASSLLHEPK